MTPVSGPEAARQALAQRSNPPAPVGAFDPNDASIVRYLGLNPSDPKSVAAVKVCQHYGLDPVMKHVVVIPNAGVYITRDGYIEIAHRSGMLDGIEVSKPVLNEEGTHWEVRAEVSRKDMSKPFIYWGRYPVNGKNKEYAQEMAVKCAESHALRRAFNVVGLGSAEERHTPDYRPDSDYEAEAEYVQEVEA